MSDRQVRFPPDLAALLGIYWILLPIAAIGMWIFPALVRVRNEGDLTILWVAIAVGAIGCILLFLARLPLYRERRFLEFGPRSLDAMHRRIYWWAWTLIFLSIVSLVFLVMLFAVLR